jgi:hypothetical protein
MRLHFGELMSSSKPWTSHRQKEANYGLTPSCLFGCIFYLSVVHLL